MESTLKFNSFINISFELCVHRAHLMSVSVCVCVREKKNDVRTIIDFGEDSVIQAAVSISHVTGHAGTLERLCAYLRAYMLWLKKKHKEIFKRKKERKKEKTLNKESARTNHQHLAHCFALVKIEF